MTALVAVLMGSQPDMEAVATVAIGAWGARNAATLAAEILALKHDDVRAYDEYRAALSGG